MRFALLTPGTGHFFCGSCLRDTALGKALRAQGHDVVMTPLYLPFVLEEHDEDERAPVRMGGINMHLQHKLPALRHTPGWISDALDSPRLLRWASRKGNMTDASQLGEMTLAMLRGESGDQAGMLAKLIEFLRSGPRPDVVCLSNVMLIGIVRALKRALDVPVVVTLQGEAPFLDALSEPYRSAAWTTLTERAAEVDAFVPVSAHYGELMRERLSLVPERVHVVHNGIDPTDLRVGEPPRTPVIGYLARMCADKGLPTLVEAYRLLRGRDRVDAPRLSLAGTLLEADRPLVEGLRRELERAGYGDQVEFLPNVERSEKLRFLEGLSVLSVPATYGESFGLYMLEAMAAGVPVVEPRCDAFPEILEATGGGLLCEPDDAGALAEALEHVLSHPEEARAMGARGRTAVLEHFNVERMAREFHAVCATTRAGA